MQITTAQSSLTYDLFVYSADENYVVSRWCMFNHMFTDFFWLAAHCLEKYLKAALLLNGRSAKKFSHDIGKMFEVALEFAGELFPSLLTQPARLDIGLWQDRQISEFIEHVARFGAPSNRYRMRGYVVQAQDLHMLDATVFAFRRICCQLDEPIVDFPNEEWSISTERDLLSKNPHYSPLLGTPIDTLIASKKESLVRNVALNMNFSFAPNNFKHTPIDNVSASSFSPIHFRIFDDLNSQDSKVVEDALHTATWLLDNVDLGSDKKDIASDIEQARKYFSAIR